MKPLRLTLLELRVSTQASSWVLFPSLAHFDLSKLPGPEVWFSFGIDPFSLSRSSILILPISKLLLQFPLQSFLYPISFPQLACLPPLPSVFFFFFNLSFVSLGPHSFWPSPPLVLPLLNFVLLLTPYLPSQTGLALGMQFLSWGGGSLKFFCSYLPLTNWPGWKILPQIYFADIIWKWCHHIGESMGNALVYGQNSKAW